jgi:uncharacterized protein YdhG (YjbR/CyaY superfamily)
MMKQPEPTINNINSYIAAQPKELRDRLEQIRQTILKAAPKAEETISYQMPAFKYNGILVYFAACKNHFGFYPTAAGIASFKNELKPYTHSKGAVQFPYDKPVPLSLISKIVKYKLSENIKKAKR